MQTSAKFLLYFKEKVAVASGGRATLKSDDSAAVTTVTPTAGTNVNDCVITIDPPLAAGKLYTLTLPSKAVTDQAPLKNGYAGTAFTFYTPSTTPFLLATSCGNNAAYRSNCEHTTTFRMTYKTTPRFGVEDADQILTVNETSTAAITHTIKMTDRDAVKFQDLNMLLIPTPPLLPGKTYTITLPKKSVRYMTRDYAFTFSTRAEDSVKPDVVYTYPTGAFAKFNIYPIAPFVLFSEGVAPGFAGKTVKFKEGGSFKYFISAADQACGTGGTTADECVEIDSLRAKVSFYPKGKLASDATKAAPWSLPGAAYSITMEAGSFTDYAVKESMYPPSKTPSWQPPLFNPIIDHSVFAFSVNADNVAPTLNTYSPSPSGFAATTNANRPNTLFLTFNENIQSGGSAYVTKATYIGTKAPSFIGQGYISQAAAIPARSASTAVALSFDAPVQAHTGNLELYFYNGHTATSPSRAASDALSTFVGNKVIFKPASSLASSTSYYVRTAAVKSPAGQGISADLNTNTLLNFNVFKNDANAMLPSPVWSSVEDYACIGNAGAGVLPDIMLYMNEDITTVDTAKFIKLYDCGAGCAAPAVGAKFASGTIKWSLKAYTASSTTALKVLIDSARAYKITIDTSNTYSIRAGSKTSAYSMSNLGTNFARSNMIIPMHDTFKDLFGQTNTNLNALPYAFSFCEAKFDTPSTKVMRVYPQNQAGGDGPFKTAGMPRTFFVYMPGNHARDVVGNTNAQSSQWTYSVEALAPTLAPDATTTNYEPQETIVLTFNEVVQVSSAASASFQIWDAGFAQAAAFDVSLGKLTTSHKVGAYPRSLLSGRRISITPRNLCDGTPACSGLVASKTYYVKSTAAAMLKDTIGTKMTVALNTKSSWSFTTTVDSNKKPEIVYHAGFGLGSTTTVTGYIYFSEHIQANSGTGKMSVIDCGGDLTCGASNSAAIIDVALTYGDGSA